MHGQQNDKYTEMHGQQNVKYTEMHGQQNDKYTEMHGQQNVKNAITCMNVILLHRDHRHVSFTHVAVFRVVSARIQIYL